MEELHECPLFHIGTKKEMMMMMTTNELAWGEINIWMLEITILVCLQVQLVSMECQTDKYHGEGILKWLILFWSCVRLSHQGWIQAGVQGKHHG
jgi:hypothetical protein